MLFYISVCCQNHHLTEGNCPLVSDTAEGAVGADRILAAASAVFAVFAAFFAFAESDAFAGNAELPVCGAAHGGDVPTPHVCGDGYTARADKVRNMPLPTVQ